MQEREKVWKGRTVQRTIFYERHIVDKILTEGNILDKEKNGWT